MNNGQAIRRRARIGSAAPSFSPQRRQLPAQGEGIHFLTAASPLINISEAALQAPASVAASADNPVGGSGSSASTALGALAADINTDTGDVTVDINLQNVHDLEAIEFRSNTFNALIPDNYFGFIAQNTLGWNCSNGSNAGSNKIVLELSPFSQTSFPTETVLDFGQFWNTATNARNPFLMYNITPPGNRLTTPITGTITYTPEPASLSLLGFSTRRDCFTAASPPVNAGLPMRKWPGSVRPKSIGMELVNFRSSSF